MREKYDRPIRATLDAEADAYVHAEARRLGIPVAAVIRQCVEARKAAQHRAEQIDPEMVAQHEGLY